MDLELTRAQAVQRLSATTAGGSSFWWYAYAPRACMSPIIDSG